MPYAADFAGGEGFLLDSDEFAGAAELVAEFAFGEEHE
jgi:hypothetical protein